MGLKGKIEAIIYAAEEPVSLEQIALLVKEPALQELAEERARVEAEQAAAKEQQENEGTVAVHPEGPSEAMPPQSDGPGEDVAAESQADSQNTEEQPITAGDADSPDTAVASEPTEASHEPTSEEPETTGTSTAVDQSVPPAIEPNPEGTSAEPIGSSETPPQTDQSAVAAVSEQRLPGSEEPLSEASEKAKSTVVSKRRAKTDIPPEVRAKVRATVEELIEDYGNPGRGMEIRQIAGGYRMTTKPEHHDVVKAFAKSLKPPLRLSMPALETLAVIAYKQPVTSPEVGEIRGVDSQGVIATLLDRKLITTAGRKAVIGRPILYKTTKEFLMRFGLNEIAELPSMEEFEKLAQEAGQVDMFQVDERNGTAPDVDADNSADSEGTDEVGDARTGAEVPEQVAAEQSNSAADASEGDSHAEDGSSTPEHDSAQSEEPVR